MFLQSGRGGGRSTSRTRGPREASFVVPAQAFKLASLHFVLAVTDDGTPALTRYRRFNVEFSDS